MNLTAYELSLIAGGFVIVGAILGAYIGYYFSIRLMVKQEFNKAAIEFRNAFLYELIFLKYNACIPEGERTYTTLNEFLFSGYVHRHLKAFEIFRNHLPAKNRADIDKAWKEYCCHPDNQDIPFFEQYSWRVANKGIDYEKQLKDIALSRIEKILEFAKPK